jgi:hypothetical protein
MSKLLYTILYVVSIILFSLGYSMAGGISVDAGLTPPEDRWIFRTQLRNMTRKDNASLIISKMQMKMTPIVLVYGLNPNLTLMLRQALINKEMTMMGSDTNASGFGDIFVLAKYKVYRLNTPEYTFGITPAFGLEFPTGSEAFTSNTLDLNMGIYFSGRKGASSVDLNAAYTLNGLAKYNENSSIPGDEVLVNLALSHQFSIDKNAYSTIAPVLELSYKSIMPEMLNSIEVLNTGGTVFYLSPGIKYTKSWIIIETLFQIPVQQYQKGAQLEHDNGILTGIRLMF